MTPEREDNAGEVLDEVAAEVQAQSAIDAADADPATKVEERLHVRRELDERLDVERDEDPNSTPE